MGLLLSWAWTPADLQSRSLASRRLRMRSRQGRGRSLCRRVQIPGLVTDPTSPCASRSQETQRETEGVQSCSA